MCAFFAVDLYTLYSLYIHSLIVWHRHTHTHTLKNIWMNTALWSTAGTQQNSIAHNFSVFVVEIISIFFIDFSFLKFPYFIQFVKWFCRHSVFCYCCCLWSNCGAFMYKPSNERRVCGRLICIWLKIDFFYSVQNLWWLKI